MDRVMNGVLRICGYFSVVGQVAMTLMVILTVADVIGRTFNRPILGTYEMVAYLGALSTSFSIPMASWRRGHVNVDILISHLSNKWKNIINIGTRFAAIALFVILSWQMFLYGIYVQTTGQVSATLRLAYAPIIYGVATALLLECIVLCCDIPKVRRGQYE
jgi:TRAP-type C4-dicarboxylate transport system permease small subunit